MGRACTTNRIFFSDVLDHTFYVTAQIGGVYPKGPPPLPELRQGQRAPEQAAFGDGPQEQKNGGVHNLWIQEFHVLNFDQDRIT